MIPDRHIWGSHMNDIHKVFWHFGVQNDGRINEREFMKSEITSGSQLLIMKGVHGNGLRNLGVRSLEVCRSEADNFMKLQNQNHRGDD
jgi:hypothetical protein